MYPFIEILEKPKAVAQLKKLGVLDQYKKNKELLLAGFSGKLDFKKRKPKKDGIYSFRINQQFRAFGRLESQKLVIFHIDQH